MVKHEKKIIFKNSQTSYGSGCILTTAGGMVKHFFIEIEGGSLLLINVIYIVQTNNGITKNKMTIK